VRRWTHAFACCPYDQVCYIANGNRACIQPSQSHLTRGAMVSKGMDCSVTNGSFIKNCVKPDNTGSNQKCHAVAVWYP
jgi:hypothetical protein